MFKTFHSLAASLAKSIGGLNATQRQIKLPVSVSLDFGDDHKASRPAPQSLMVDGMTQKLSLHEIAFIVPFIRLGDYHLAGHGGEQKRLKLVLEMPNGEVRMTVVAKQYQMIELHSSVQNYLIETKIVSLSESDAKRYSNFLNHGEKIVSTRKIFRSKNCTC